MSRARMVRRAFKKKEERLRRLNGLIMRGWSPWIRQRTNMIRYWRERVTSVTETRTV